LPVQIQCPVRGCGAPLDRQGPRWTCPHGHAFDRARSGYCNLLQPQDRRSRRPGDPAAVVAARRRFLDAGHGDPLLAVLRSEISALALPPGSAVLDVGCGEGTYLGRLLETFDLEAHGLDLAADAVDAAARRFPRATWIVANADRGLPYASASFGLVLSLDARLPVAEIARVLRPEGHLLIAVPAPDDLVELRAAVLGQGEEKDRFARAESLLAERFELVQQRTERAVARLDADEARDALTATYRAGRASRAAAIAALGPIEVTLAHTLGLFRVRGSS
jgi:23S rRNA (guanine745-N1)-methyltransferase